MKKFFITSIFVLCFIIFINKFDYLCNGNRYIGVKNDVDEEVTVSVKKSVFARPVDVRDIKPIKVTAEADSTLDVDLTGLLVTNEEEILSTVVRDEEIIYVDGTMYDYYSDSQIGSSSTPGAITDGRYSGYHGYFNRKLKAAMKYGNRNHTPTRYPMYLGNFLKTSSGPSYEGILYPTDEECKESNFWRSANSGVYSTVATPGLIDNRLTFQTLPVGTVVDGKQIINHDFYNYTGIHRDVCVYAVPTDHIEDIIIHTVVDGDYSKVKVELSGSNKNTLFVVKDATGRVVVSSRERVFYLPDVQLWSPDSPYLYTLVVKTETDSYEETFGVRRVEVTENGFFLNGQPIYMKGFGMHEDFYLLGKGNNSAVGIRNFELLKWIGANSVRTSHYPYSEEFMEIADRYGILVIDELPAVGMNWWHDNFTPERINDETLELHKELTTQLIARDKNHPCVVMLSVSNEAGTHEPASRPYFKELIEHARKITDLPIMNVEFTKFDDGCQVADLVDVIGLNRYYGWYTDHGNLTVIAEQMQAEMEKFHKEYKKPILITEYGADTIEGLHSVPSETFSEEFQKEYLEECGKAFDACDFCIGEQVWNFADFKTKQGLTRIRGNRKGIFTKDRQPKQAAHYLKDRWKNI